MKRKGHGSILSFYIGYFSFWHTLNHASLQCPQRPGISAHWTHKINTKINLLKLSLFVCTQKNNGRDAWSCSTTGQWLVFTSDRVRVGDRKRRNKSAYDLVNIKKIIISATESESEESERFHFLQTPRLTFGL